MNRSLIFAVFVSFAVLLAGCASPDPAAISVGEIEQLDQEARAELATLRPEISQQAVHRQQGPVDLPASGFVSGTRGRALWQEDRNRLRACVATHASLVGELTVANVIRQAGLE